MVSAVATVRASKKCHQIGTFREMLNVALPDLVTLGLCLQVV